MVVSPRPWLIDKSALVRIGAAPDAHVWADRIERGMVRIATVTLLETGYSARTAGDLAQLLDMPPLANMPVIFPALARFHCEPPPLNKPPSHENRPPPPPP